MEEKEEGKKIIKNGGNRQVERNGSREKRKGLKKIKELKRRRREEKTQNEVKRNRKLGKWKAIKGGQMKEREEKDLQREENEKEKQTDRNYLYCQ